MEAAPLATFFAGHRFISPGFKISLCTGAGKEKGEVLILEEGRGKPGGDGRSPAARPGKLRGAAGVGSARPRGRLRDRHRRDHPTPAMPPGFRDSGTSGENLGFFYFLFLFHCLFPPSSEGSEIKIVR